MPQIYNRKCKNSICLILAIVLAFAGGCEKNENKTKASSSYAVPNTADTIISYFFVDSRDSTKYRYVKIGTKFWMAENLNYAIDNSACYENNEDNCQKCGRLYDGKTAVKACPNGWHLATSDDWGELEDIIEKDLKRILLRRNVVIGR